MQFLGAKGRAYRATAPTVAVWPSTRASDRVFDMRTSVNRPESAERST